MHPSLDAAFCSQKTHSLLARWPRAAGASWAPFRFACIVLFVCFLPMQLQPSLAQESARLDKVKKYVELVRGAERKLAEGDVAAARELLDKTDPAQRSLEFDYLGAQIAAMQASDPAKKSAPELVKVVARPDVETRYPVMNPTARQIVFICRDGSLRVLDLSEPDAKYQTVRGEVESAIWTGVFSDDGKTFVTGNQDGEVMLWETETWKVRQTFSLGEAWPVRELAVAPDGSSVVAESKKELQLWSMAGEQPEKIAAVGERYNFGEGLAFSPRGDLIATGGMFDILLHDAKTGELKKEITHASYTMGLAFSPDGSKIASAPRGNVNKFLGVFGVEDGGEVFNAGPFKQHVAGIAFTPDGKRIIATGRENTVRLFDADTGLVALTIKRAAATARPAITADGKLLGWYEPDFFCYVEFKEP